MTEAPATWRFALPVGALAGLASAVLFLAGLRGGTVGTVLMISAPLPLFLAGLGWGFSAVLVGAAGAIALLIATGNHGAAVVFAAFSAAAPVAITYLAFAAARPGLARSGAEPTVAPGQAIALLAILGAAIILAALLAAESAGGLGALVERTLNTAQADMALAQKQFAEQGVHMDGTQMADMVTKALPPAFAAAWLIIAVCNAVLAEEILARSGRALRPPPLYSALELPRALAMGLAGAIALCFAPGWLGGLGMAMAALFGGAYFFLGLAVIHVMSRRLPNRPIVLGLVYLTLALAAGLAAVVIAGLGLVDQWRDLRGRALRNEQEMP